MGVNPFLAQVLGVLHTHQGYLAHYNRYQLSSLGAGWKKKEQENAPLWWLEVCEPLEHFFKIVHNRYFKKTQQQKMLVKNTMPGESFN